MSVALTALRFASRGILGRNARFKGRHSGETCYIIGNGASLKYMELEAFSNHPSITLNLLCMHNEYAALDARYHVLVEPRFFYHLTRNPYTGAYQGNVLGTLFRDAFSEYPEVTLFANLSNILGFRFRRAYYLYHFGNRRPTVAVCDIAGAFSLMISSFYAAIGLAINLGFRKAILVGCDYTFTPQNDGHFYTFGPPIRSDRYENPYEKLFAEAAPFIELTVITDTAKCEWLPFQTYEQHIGRSVSYRENSEITRPEYLARMQLSIESKQYTGSIYPPT